MSKIRKLLKALSGTVSWSLKVKKAPGADREPIAGKEKQEDTHSSNFKGFA